MIVLGDHVEIIATIPYLLSFAIFIIGLCLGSFATAIISREARGLSWFELRGQQSRSACPHCDHILKITDLVPFFSSLLLGFKCRYCRAPIARFYPVTELVIGFSAVALYWSLGAGALLFIALLLLPFLYSVVYLAIAKRVRSGHLIALILFICLSFWLISSLVSPL